jgi:hypothetical protein
MVDDEEVVAQRVVSVEVPPRDERGRIRGCRELVVEHLEAQSLRPADLLRPGGKPDLQGAEPPEERIEAAVAEDAGVRLGARKERDGGRAAFLQRPQDFREL